MVGPVIHKDRFSIMLMFRLYKYTIGSDIKKMYRQILIHDADQKYQRILWRDVKDESIGNYNLKTVTFGTSCAPFLATRVLEQLSEDEKQNYPLAAAAIDDFYMDDILTGSNDINEAIKLRDELIGMFTSAKMKLQKWFRIRNNC